MLKTQVNSTFENVLLLKLLPYIINFYSFGDFTKKVSSALHRTWLLSKFAKMCKN